MCIRDSIYPAAVRFTGDLAESALRKRSLLQRTGADADTERVERLSGLTDRLAAAAAQLRGTLQDAQQEDALACAEFCHTAVLADMTYLRQIADELEQWVERSYWPMPTYTDMLYAPETAAARG